MGRCKNLPAPHFLKVETDTDNIKGSGHSLNQFSGLWIKGEAGENYITIWDDEPVKRMDLEIEMEEEEQERIEPVPAAPEVEFEKPLNGVRHRKRSSSRGWRLLRRIFQKRIWRPTRPVYRKKSCQIRQQASLQMIGIRK